MKIVDIILRVIIIAVSLILLFSGFQWAFMPDTNMTTNGITASSPLGRNMIKSDIGAGLIGAAIFLFLYALKKGFWFYPSVIMTGSYLVIRVVSLISDGSHRTVVVGIIMEAFVIGVLMVMRRMEIKGRTE